MLFWFLLWLGLSIWSLGTKMIVYHVAGEFSLTVLIWQGRHRSSSHEYNHFWVKTYSLQYKDHPLSGSFVDYKGEDGSTTVRHFSNDALAISMQRWAWSWSSKSLKLVLRLCGCNGLIEKILFALFLFKAFVLLKIYVFVLRIPSFFKIIVLICCSCWLIFVLSSQWAGKMVAKCLYCVATV